MFFVGTSSHGIFRSSNQGQTWSKADSGLLDNSVACLSTDGKVIYAGSYSGYVSASTDFGAHWSGSKLTFESNDIRSFLIKNDTVYASTFKGIFRSNDSAMTWAALNEGLRYQTVYQLFEFDTSMFAVGEAGAYRSNNQATYWMRSSAVVDAQLSTLTTFRSMIFAGTEYGVARSIDNCRTWRDVSSGIPDPVVRSLVVKDTTLFVGTLDGVYRSSDYGETWKSSNNGLPKTTITSLAAAAFLFAGTSINGVFRSSDNGVSWQCKSNGLTVHGHKIDEILIGKSAVFVATADGVFRSTDNGENWIRTSFGIGSTYKDIRSLLQSDSLLFAGTSSTIFVSSDNGDTWKATSFPMVAAYTLASDGKNIYAGSDHDGVYRSPIIGEKWTEEGLGPTSVYKLSIIGDSIYAATWEGLWRRPLSDFQNSRVNSTYKLSSLSSYPNPSSSRTTISFALPASSFVKLIVMDDLGRDVITLVSEHMSAGDHIVEWNVIDIQSGTYFYTLEAGDIRETKKLMIVQ